MNFLTNFLIGAVVGGLVVYLIQRKQKTGLSLIKRQGDEKAANKEIIMQFFENREKVTNDDVQKLLGVSDATATRYLDELEKEGRVRQASAAKYTYYVSAGSTRGERV